MAPNGSLFRSFKAKDSYVLSFLSLLYYNDGAYNLFMVRALFFSIFLLAYSVACPVNAAEYRIELHQIYPKTVKYGSVCSSENRKEYCNIFMGVVPQDERFERLDMDLVVTAIFKNDRIYFQFRSGQEYFVTSASDHIFDMPFFDMPSEFRRERVKLYRLPQSAKDDPVGMLRKLLVKRPLIYLAELEIAVTKL